MSSPVLHLTSWTPRNVAILLFIVKCTSARPRLPQTFEEYPGVEGEAADTVSRDILEFAHHMLQPPLEIRGSCASDVLKQVR